MTRHRNSSRPLNEAADWFARLNQRSITAQSLREFRDWRREPANDAAYAEVEQAWSRAGGLADDPELRAATFEVLDRQPARARRRRRWSLMIISAGLALAAGAAAIAVFLPPWFLQPSYATGVGEQRLIVLKDGSRVRLNTDSRIAVRFRGRERRIQLQRGEAFFEVAHDASRPFVVDAGDAAVHDLGTKFDVRRIGPEVRVVLVQGSVQVRSGDERAWSLAPDQQLTLRPGVDASRRQVNAEDAVSWTAGRLVFHDTPLGQALAEVNRYSAHKVELRASSLAAAPVNGVFDAGDTSAFVSAVSSLFGLKASAADDGSVVLDRGNG